MKITLLVSLFCLKATMASHIIPEGPLILTPLIESGCLDEAKQRSKVLSLPNSPSFPKLNSFSGLITVNSKFDSQMFFWFFANENPGAPIILWLEGGPGDSGLSSLFGFNGPLLVNKDGNGTSERKYSWTRDFHVIYVDNPVGTGFSRSDDEGYSKTKEDYTENLFEFLNQFFTLFHEYSQNEFYISGHSYGGKYVPALGYKLHKNKGSVNCNLTGFFIGCPFTEPAKLIENSDFLYKIGLVNAEEAKEFKEHNENVIKLYEKGEIAEAGRIWLEHLYGSAYLNATGFDQIYNYLYSRNPEAYAYYEKFIEREDVRVALHVGMASSARVSELDVEELLIDDMLRSVKPELEILSNHYRIMIFNGQNDMFIPPYKTQEMISSMERWKGVEEWAKAKKKVWKVSEEDEEVAGYATSVEIDGVDFNYVTVRNAGHIVPFDQPRASYHLLRNFISRF